MNTRIHISLLSLVAFTSLCSCAMAQRIVDVEDEIKKKASEIKSFRAKMTTETKIDNEYLHESKLDATMELSRVGDDILYRMEGTITGRYMPPERAMRFMDRDTLTVCDGKNIYYYVDGTRERFPIKSAAKNRIDAEAPLFPNDRFFNELRTDKKLDLLPDDKVNGQEAYVIVATPHDPGRFRIKRKITWFSKENGLILKQVTYDLDDTPYNTMEMTDIQTNVKIDPARFSFKTPEGVTVQDLTQVAAPAATSAAEKKADEKDAESDSAGSNKKGSEMDSSDGHSAEPKK
ncbi:MAG: outer membrane lipoprotein carrier protein LolA [Phycisphaerae bacterium]|nr:outer membrane lipoprotein carrier protein LolA [Phycisphaerae bacterium]